MKSKLNEKPLVSVIICVFNVGRLLREALNSVVHQTYKELEIVVIDDGSTDGCMEYIKDIIDPRIVIIRQENRGRPATLNRALGLIKGEFYVIQDADDISYPERIERQIECMLKHPDLAAVYTGHDMIIGKWKNIAPCVQGYSPEEASDRIRKMNVVALDPTGLLRVSKVKEIFYSESLPYVEAVDYMIRVGEKFPIMVLGECLYTYRIRWDSITRQRNPLLRMQMLWDSKRDTCIRRGLDPIKYLGPRPDTATKLTNSDYDNNLASYFILGVKSCVKKGMRRKAVEAGLVCASLQPLDWNYWKALVYALSPECLIDFAQWKRQRAVIY